jgi:Zn-finger nucleic acid-binding protein
MLARDTSGVTLDECTGCGGVWVDPQDVELAVVLHAFTPLTQDARVPEGAELCPRCSEPLSFHLVHGVRAFVHRCATCGGTFVPADALHEIAGLPQGTRFDSVRDWSKVARPRPLKR